MRIYIVGCYYLVVVNVAISDTVVAVRADTISDYAPDTAPDTVSDTEENETNCFQLNVKRSVRSTIPSDLTSSGVLISRAFGLPVV